MRLTSGNNALFHMYQDFVLASGLRSVTVGIRYRLLTATANAFRFDLFDVATSTRLGFFSDTDVGGGTTTWKIRSLTGRFDGLTGGVQGPRTLRVRIYPYNAALPIPGKQVIIDSVWLIDGEYAAPYRPYSEGIELLRGDDREVFINEVNRTTAFGPVSLLPTNVPANAVGMIVDIRIQSTAAATTFTYLRVDDNEGTVQTRDFYALVNNKYTQADYLMPITPGGTLPQWQIVGPAMGNQVSCAVRLKAWVLRM